MLHRASDITSIVVLNSSQQQHSDTPPPPLRSSPLNWLVRRLTLHVGVNLHKVNSAARGNSAARSSPRHIEDYDLIDFLGAGGFGMVLLAKEQASKKLYAMKVRVVIREPHFHNITNNAARATRTCMVRGRVHFDR